MSRLSLQEQRIIYDKCLEERLETIVPKVLNDYGVDAWIIACKEYHEDFVFHVLTPSTYPTARRTSMLVFIKQGDVFKRFSLCMPDKAIMKYYEQYYKFNQEEQITALNRLFDEYKPNKIAINLSEEFTYGDGLSYGIYQTLLNGLKEEHKAKLMSEAMIPIKVMELRTPTELEVHPLVMKEAFSIIEEVFSTKTIVPGKTTTTDLEFALMEKTIEAGYEYWFQPTIDKMHYGNTNSRHTGVIQYGDLLHCDFGIKYLNICTDTQRLAYVASKEETNIPSWMLEGFKIANRFQDIVCESMKEGITGNECLHIALDKAKQEGIKPCLYSHPCNLYGHGPGPTIGLWNNQDYIPGSGNITLSYNTTYALELNITHEYEGIPYTFCLEETIALKEDGCEFLYPNRDQIYFVK